MSNIFNELKKRKVFRTTGIYLGTAFIILQVADILVPRLFMPDWTMRLIILFLILGFPITVILSFVYDINEKGIVKTKKTNVPGLNQIVIISAILIGFLGTFYIYTNQVTNSVNSKSIAVIPFDNFTGSEKDYMSDGFTETIIANLAKIKDLTVISRTSVMKYKNSNMNLKDIAIELGVANILEGSIQLTENKIRITAQLIEAETDKHLWAETYDRDINDIFDIQTDISKQISQTLHAKLTNSEKNKIEDKITNNTQAYDLYLKASEIRRNPAHPQNRNPDFIINLYQQALILDSNMAEVYAALSSTYSEMVHYGFDRSEKTIQLAKQNIEKALRLKPNNAEVRYSYGYYYYACYRDYFSALENYEKALEDAPGHADIIALTAYAHRRMGHKKETIEGLKKAAILDPNNVNTHHELFKTYEGHRMYNKLDYKYYFDKGFQLLPDAAFIYQNLANHFFYFEGNTKNARKIINKGQQLFPKHDYSMFDFDFYDKKYEGYEEDIKNNFPEILYGTFWIRPKTNPLAWINAVKGNEKSAKKYAQQSITTLEEIEKEFYNDPRFYSEIAYAYAIANKKKKAITAAKKALELYPREKDYLGHDHYLQSMGIVYILTGDINTGLDIIEEMLTGTANLRWWDIKYDFLLQQRIGNNPRFQKIIQKEENKFKNQANWKSLLEAYIVN